MTEPTQKPPVGGRMPVHFPKNLEPIYANFALITNTRSEIVIDFAQILPQIKHARVHNRVVMTPFNAKLLHRALGDHIAKFEERFGEIELPEGTSLADQLFRPTQNDDGEDDQTDE
ncbi:MAG: DUF3467 domain-containing protein [Anaerolineales bacterium]|nr:DUF3467 domain-containing protein [Anaerolineales bacterium]